MIYVAVLASMDGLAHKLMDRKRSVDDRMNDLKTKKKIWCWSEFSTIFPPNSSLLGIDSFDSNLQVVDPVLFS